MMIFISTHMILLLALCVLCVLCVVFFLNNIIIIIMILIKVLVRRICHTSHDESSEIYDILYTKKNNRR